MFVSVSGCLLLGEKAWLFVCVVGVPDVYILIYLKPSAECACCCGSKWKLPLMVQMPTLVLNQFFVCGQYGNSETSVSVFILVKVPLFVKHVTLKMYVFFLPSIHPSIHHSLDQKQEKGNH